MIRIVRRLKRQPLRVTPVPLDGTITGKALGSPIWSKGWKLSWSLQNWKLPIQWHSRWEIMTHNEEFTARRRSFSQSTFSPSSMASSSPVLFQISDLRDTIFCRQKKSYKMEIFFFFLTPNYRKIYLPFPPPTFLCYGKKSIACWSLNNIYCSQHTYYD